MIVAATEFGCAGRVGGRWALGWVIGALLVLAACAGGADGDSTPHPLVAEIGPALDRLEPDTELFQVSGTPEGVELVVSNDGQAIGYTYAAGELSAGEPLGAATGLTFLPADVTFDPAHVLDGVTGELDDPVITRFEVVAGPAGVVYSALVLSDAGGVLQVDLAADGTVQKKDALGAQCRSSMFCSSCRIGCNRFVGQSYR